MNRKMTMKQPLRLLAVFAGLILATSAIAQDSEQHELKLMALEALMTAPPDRALPRVLKVLESNESPEFKERALFILSQINHPDAASKLMELANDNGGDLQHEAVRMVGISGNREQIAKLRPLYATADEELKDSILEAYLIANDREGVLEIAQAAQDPEDFERAVNILGAMGAREELRVLRSRGDMSESIIQALAISGDVDTLLDMARDGSNLEQQVNAIEALGIAGGGGEALIGIYRESDSQEVRDAVRHGLLVSGHDEGVIDLYREAADVDEKKDLLELLVMMGSDQAMDVIDAALAGDQ